MLREGEGNQNCVRVASARKLARKLLRSAKIDSPPVLIKRLVPFLEKEHELVIRPWLLSDHVSGFLLEEDGCAAIAYNKNHHIHRQRFTVAHEIGHLILGHNNRNKGRDRELDEKEAQIFATELLMPLEFLKVDLRSDGCDLERLARRYWVSSEAMSWRIQDKVVKCPEFGGQRILLVRYSVL